jgi:hypothetical protein
MGGKDKILYLDSGKDSRKSLRDIGLFSGGKKRGILYLGGRQTKRPSLLGDKERIRCSGGR